MNHSLGNTDISIQLKSVAKKFGQEWIFKNIDILIEPGATLAITGPNGSGKSTLLKLIAGITTPNKGEVFYTCSTGKKIEPENLYTHLSYCAPYLDLPEELTLNELLVFHCKLRTTIMSAKELIDVLGIDPHKEIRNYSSGMKQRVKLVLAVYTQSALLFLDEPTAYLDDEWSNKYMQMMHTATTGRTVIVCSNVSSEYSFCKQILDISNYK